MGVEPPWRGKSCTPCNFATCPAMVGWDGLAPKASAASLQPQGCCLTRLQRRWPSERAVSEPVTE